MNKGLLNELFLVTNLAVGFGACYGSLDMIFGRFCEVHLALAELCVACHQHRDCYVHVRLVASVLDPKKHRRVVLPIKLKSDIAAGSTHHVPDFANGSDGDEEEGTDFLRSCVTSLDYQVVSDPCGSPTTTERFTVSLPPTWKHRAKCDCTLCLDTAMERIWLRSYVVEATNRLHQDNLSDSKTMLMTAIKQRDRLLSNISAQTSMFGSAVHDSHIREKALQLLVASAVYQTDFDVIALSLCEAAFLGKDSKHFSSCYSQAEEALQSNHLPSEWSHIHLAELFYIGSTPSLLWPSAAQLVPKSKLSSIDILCAGIGRMNVSEVVTPPNPARKSKKTERVASLVACDGDEKPDKSQKSRDSRSSNFQVGAPLKSRPVAAKVSGRSRNSTKETVQVADTSALIGKKSEKASHIQKSSGTIYMTVIFGIFMSSLHVAYYLLIVSTVTVAYMRMMVISGFIHHVINSPHTCYQSTKQVGFQMSSEHQGG